MPFRPQATGYAGSSYVNPWALNPDDSGEMLVNGRGITSSPYGWSEDDQATYPTIQGRTNIVEAPRTATGAVLTDEQGNQLV